MASHTLDALGEVGGLDYIGQIVFSNFGMARVAAQILFSRKTMVLRYFSSILLFPHIFRIEKDEH